MIDPLFSLTQLKYIIEVDRLKSFHQAAKVCHVSQPTLSMQIQKVESFYQTQIFIRNKKKVTTTEKGERIVLAAKEILSKANSLHHQLLDDDKDIKGTYRLGIIPTISPYLLPFFLNTFTSKYPDCKLEVEEMQTNELTEALRAGKIDFGILATPLKMEDLKESPLYYEEFLFYLPKNHPLLKKNDLKAKDLPLNEMLLLDDGHCFKNQALEICKSVQKKPSLHLRTGSIQTLIHLSDKQNFSTFIPELSYHYLNSQQKKQSRRLSPHVYREVSLVTTKSFYREKLLQAITEEIQTALPSQIFTQKPKKVLDLHL